jgi:hypothetical protein
MNVGSQKLDGCGLASYRTCRSWLTGGLGSKLLSPATSSLATASSYEGGSNSSKAGRGCGRGSKLDDPLLLLEVVGRSADAAADEEAVEAARGLEERDLGQPRGMQTL